MPSKSQTTTKVMKKHLNVLPGELLREEFLSPLGITPDRLAKDAKLPHQRINEIVNEKRGITAETDLHLTMYFGQNPGYWLRVQLAYDLREALQDTEGALPTSFLAALHVVGDQTCLEPLAGAYARSNGDERWKVQLAAAYRAIARREKVTRRHPIARRISARWAEASRELMARA